MSRHIADRTHKRFVQDNEGNTAQRVVDIRRQTAVSTIVDDASADGVGSAVDVGAYKDVVVYIATENSADVTIKCQGSFEATAPTWGSARSKTNRWDYIGMWDYDQVDLVKGDTGVVPGGTDITKAYLVNTDFIRFINFELSSYVAGNVNVYLAAANT